jgi:D-alanyl-D-alanine carboxypeptidase (penicillin-binding protein 5/6)
MLLKYFQDRLLALSAVSLLFIVTFNISLIEKPAVYLTNARDYNVSPLPVLKNAATFPLLTAEGVYAYDLDSGVVLYEKSSEVPLFPASTTKIVTALVALDYYKMDQIINTGVFSASGSRMGLAWREDISFKDLFYGLMVYSANDAAEVLANNFPGGRKAFVEAMNKKARELHAYNTNFENPSGLDDSGQETTAKDLARISSQAMLRKEFADVVSTKDYVAKNSNGTILHQMTNRNELLGEIPGVLGVKTGWTPEARENLVTYINRDGRRVMISLLGSQDRFGETKELLNWIFANYEWKNISYSEVSSP